MANPIEMPKLGNTVEECLLARWVKQPGDAVAEGELIAEIETDKATFELTAPAAGTLLAAFCQAGDLVPVFTNICVLGDAGEDVEPFRPRAATSAPAAAAAASSSSAPKATGATVSAELQQPAPPPAARSAWSPRAHRFAERHDFHPDQVAGSGAGGRVMEEDLGRLYRSLPRPTALARRMRAEGFEPRGEATGLNGMLRSSDLGPPAEKMSNLRQRIARRMRESLSATAQYTMSTSADATGLLELRARIKAARATQPLPDININELVMFCAVQALSITPELNVRLIDGHLHTSSAVDIGFACDTPRGLLVPVVRDAQTLSLRDFASRVKTLTAQAVGGTISPDDLAGGTFTVSNLGMFGVESFTPILAPPQVSILGVDAITLRPLRRNGHVEFVDHIGLSLTCDHQVIDGAPGARFLKTVREQIENVVALAGLSL